ncbi:MAG: hypothetical protein RIM99_00025, partial [Cyclobacteriaceae bacterium]
MKTHSLLSSGFAVQTIKQAFNCPSLKVFLLAIMSFGFSIISIAGNEVRNNNSKPADRETKERVVLSPFVVPILTLDVGNLAYTENGAAAQISSGATLVDPDDNWNGGTLTVQITAANEAADEISIPDNIVGTINTSGTSLLDNVTPIGTLSASEGTVTNGTVLTITFNASATTALVGQTIQAIHYRNTSEDPSGTTRTVTFVATDQNTDTDSGTRDIDVTQVNDEPTLSGTADDPTFIENGSAQGIWSSTSVSTVESVQTITQFVITV